jgi:UDP-N-acetylglucosamine--N-acetylmuramyl-(pentapeptide) pyrophosphoryl-undecaprenol N-acetylglucosamine transferase
VTPALALAEQIRAQGDEVLLLGSKRGLETRMVPGAGFELLALPAQPVYGRSLLGRLLLVPTMLRACFSAWRALGSFGARFVISIGGYASVPAVVAAVLRGIPIALVEPNAIPGRANRMAANRARRIYVQFDAAAQALGGAGERLHSFGIPLRERHVAAFENSQQPRTPQAPFRLLVTGGSQGARQINEAMIEAAALLDPASIEIFHQSGEADRERTEAAYRQAKLHADVVAFESDMPSRYRWADIVLCRAGAITVAELSLSGLPALLVPYPFAADNHQAANAAALQAVGAGRILDEQPLPGERVAAELRALFDEPAKLTAMGRSAATLGRPDAAQRIIADCVSEFGTGR